MTDAVDWIELSEYGAKLSVLRFPDARTRVVLTGIKEGSDHWRWAESCGYRASPNRLALFTDDTRVNFTKFMAQFPLAKRVRLPRNHIVRIVSPSGQRAAKAEVELKSARTLGLNHLGQSVYESAAGRYVQPAEGNRPISEREAHPSVFIRGNSIEDLALCADGFVEEMVRGETMRADDLRRFAGVVYGLPGAMPVGDVRLRSVQEAIEAAMQRRLEKAASIADHEAFRWAVALTERQPPFIYRTSSSVENQQYSTVLPLAVAVQRMAGNTSGKRVLEPTIGNASLVSILPAGTEICGYEIDPMRVSAASSLRDDLVVHHGDFTKILPGETVFDVVVSNPPFGGLFPNEEIEGLRVSRLDHLILMRSLQMRSDEGRSVYIIGADRENLVDKNAGKVSGGSKNLFNWLADHYELEGVAEVDGRLYEKQGAGYPVRLVVVGRRRTEEEAAAALKTKSHRLGESVPVLRCWDEVWAFAEAHSPVAQAAIEAEFQPAESVVEGVAVQRTDNDYQTPYVASSKIAEPTAMIPRNIQAPVSIALDALEMEHGSVDEYVAEALQMSVAELAEAFSNSPEQVDAIALAIASVNDEKGFITGDQTGFGKGRILAAMARYAALQKRHIVFLTEKPNLFSDLWRDISDICVDRDPKQLFTPLILNDGESIRDDRNRIVFPSTKKEVVKRLLDSNVHPEEEGYTITFATYSQFNRELAKSAKAGWLGRAASGSLLLLDESHNGAGNSNTAINIAAAVEKAWGCVYSSATYAKNAKNMAAYSKVFPDTISTSELPEVLEAGGEALLEILSANLAEDGRYIRREHDLSNLVFETVQDRKYFERNKDLSNRLSEILLAMSTMSGDVERMCNKLNKELQAKLKKLGTEQKKGRRMGVSSVNFGSRLYNILRQFQLAIKVDVAVDTAIAALNAGQKPVIGTEQTMEALLTETLFANDEFDEVEEIGEEVKIDDVTVIPKLTFRDVLYRVLNKIDTIIERNDYGSVTRTTALAKAESKEEAEAWARAKSYIERMIDKFPELPVSPLDTIREKIEAAGYSCAEISGRKFLVHSTASGDLSVTTRPDDRLKTIHDFNNGLIDAVILTRAGCTGNSLHASEKFDDQRQRVFIELQIANNVAERMQFWGRVNRRGQVCSPMIRTLSSGLPSEMRILAMQNAKLRKLSANTSSNRENAAESKDIPDILNPLGNQVVFRFLESNPTIAERLGIRLDEEDELDDLYFVNKLTGRIALLPYDEQENALDLISTEFTTTLEALDRAGENPFKLKENEWGARVVARELFDGAENAHASVFERPVYLTTLEWEEDVVPMRWEDVDKAVALSIESLLRDGRVALAKEKVNGYGLVDLTGVIEEINACYNKTIDEVLPNVLNEKKGIKTFHDAMRAEGPNAVKSAVERRNFLTEAINRLVPGRMVTFINAESAEQTGMVVDLRLPEDPRFQHLLGKYDVLIAVPGEKRPQHHTVYSLQKNGLPSCVRIRSQDDIKRQFDEAPTGKLTRQRTVLDGNLFRAAQIAVQMNLGRSGIYVDEHGQRQRAIIVRPGIEAATIKEAPPRIPYEEMAIELLRRIPRLGLSTSSSSVPGSGAVIRGLDAACTSFILIAPGSKQTGGKFFLDKELVGIVGEFSGNRTQMSARVEYDALPAVIERLWCLSGELYAPPKLRDEINGMQVQPSLDEGAKGRGVGLAA